MAELRDYTDNIIKSIVDILLIINPDATIRTVNQAAVELLGYYREDELIGKPVATIFAEEATPFNGTKMKKLIEEGSIRDCETTYKTKSGEKIPVSLSGSVMRDKDGSLVGIVCIAKDISEQKKIEETLKGEEFKLRTIIEQDPDGIIIVNKDGIVLFFNEAVMFLFNRRKDELLGKPLGIHITKDESVEIEVIRTSGEMGAVGTAQMHVTEIEWDKNPVYLLTVHDTTEIKKTEALKAELAERKKLDRIKDEFIGTVSHELRTPLTAMKEFTSIISDEIPGKLTKDQKEYVNIIKDNINRLARLINNLLDISKIEAGKTELKKTLVDITNLANSVISTLKPQVDEKHIEFKTLFPISTIDVYADADKIIQVFTNLIGNAIKFTPENGQITVEIKDMEKEIECSVADTGVGIARENLGKLFTKFQQFDRVDGAGAKGTGLGLAISRELIQAHNGKIWAESKFGKGSKFIFTLPK